MRVTVAFGSENFIAVVGDERTKFYDAFDQIRAAIKAVEPPVGEKAHIVTLSVPNVHTNNPLKPSREVGTQNFRTSFSNIEAIKKALIVKSIGEEPHSQGSQHQTSYDR